MRTVHKYSLAYTPETIQPLLIPTGAQLVATAMQGCGSKSRPTLWLEVETENECEERYFVLLGTGVSLPDALHSMSAHHAGTLFHDPFVWHVYELRHKQVKGNEIHQN